MCVVGGRGRGEGLCLLSDPVMKKAEKMIPNQSIYPGVQGVEIDLSNFGKLWKQSSQLFSIQEPG